MRISRNPSPFPNDKAPKNARRHGRVRCEYLTCYYNINPFGTVVDLSASGLRIFHKGGCSVRKGDHLALTLIWFDVRVPVMARVAWTNRVGFRKHDVGVEFINMTPSSTAAISHLQRVTRDAVMLARETFGGV